MGNREVNPFLKFRRILIAGMILLVFNAAIQPAYGQGQEFYFTEIYVDGIEADSEGGENSSHGQ